MEYTIKDNSVIINLFDLMNHISFSRMNLQELKSVKKRVDNLISAREENPDDIRMEDFALSKHISTRLMNICHHLQVTKWSHFQDFRLNDIKRKVSIGPIIIDEIESQLSRRGLSFL